MKRMLVLVLFMQIFCFAEDRVDVLTGTYEMVYKHNHDDWIQNEYLVFKTDKNTLTGTFYGTSDDFDDAREGYLPGFFKVKMKNLKYHAGKLSFDIVVTQKSLYKKHLSPLKTQRSNSSWGNSDGVLSRSSHPFAHIKVRSLRVR